MNFADIKAKLSDYEARIKNYVESLSHVDPAAAQLARDGAPGFFSELSKVGHELHTAFAGFAETAEARIRTLEADGGELRAKVTLLEEKIASLLPKPH